MGLEPCNSLSLPTAGCLLLGRPRHTGRRRVGALVAASAAGVRERRAVLRTALRAALRAATRATTRAAVRAALRAALRATVRPAAREAARAACEQRRGQ